MAIANHSLSISEMLRNHVEFVRNPIGLISRLGRDQRDIVPVLSSPVRIVLAKHPDYIKAVLVERAQSFTSVKVPSFRFAVGESLVNRGGDLHTRQRTILEPQYQQPRIRQCADRVVSAVDDYCKRWSHGAEIDLTDEMIRLLVTAVSAVLCGEDDRPTEQELKAATIVNRYLATCSIHPAVAQLEMLPLSRSNWRFRSALRTLRQGADRRVRDRRAAPGDRDDLLSSMLRLRDPKDGSRLSDRQLRDEMVGSYTAGLFNLSTLFVWVWYLLSKHPEVENNVHHELDAVLNGNLPSSPHLCRLVVTRSVVTETLRLYPPAWIIGRRVLNDVELGGHHVRTGSIVLMSQLVTHRDERFYDAPVRFLPERWTAEADENRPEFAYFPFSGGPRGCLGSQFAQMLIPLVIAVVSQKWRLQFASGHSGELEFRSGLSLSPEPNVVMRTVQRVDSPNLASV